ncbi:hypothetical protein M0R45_001490 [Rubus argutus]|uniref:RRM domain-containing protein n=1 Tax=Rubus argutus TaxID=59490 RepID=A0AAW1VH47_RUBAR
MDAEQTRKLFVAGIPRQMVNETILEEHFSQYGEVEECLIPLDRFTGQSRGFGFVTFTEQLVAERVLEESHSIFGKRIYVHPSEPRRERNLNNQEDQHVQRQGPYHPKMIFVGGLPHHLTEEDFINCFAMFGAIEDGVIIYDKITNMPRGFGFITFESEEAVKDVLKKSFYEVKNKMVEVQRARLEVGYECEKVGLEFVGGLQIDDLAFGVNSFFCYDCGGAYGYGHYSGCMYGKDPYNGVWRAIFRRVLHTWNVYPEPNEHLLTYVNPEL